MWRRPACRALAADGVEAVAVCFLHSYANPEHERIAGEMIEEALPGRYVSLSHEILREYREYERMSTTVVNAYIGPKVGGYVQAAGKPRNTRFPGRSRDHAVERRRHEARGRDRRPVVMMESGPVGGIIASAKLGKRLATKTSSRSTWAARQQRPASCTRRADHGAGILRRRLCERPSGDDADCRRGRGRRGRRRSPGSTKSARSKSGRKVLAPIPDRSLSPRRQEPTITDANVMLGRIDPIFSAARCGSTPMAQSAA